MCQLALDFPEELLEFTENNQFSETGKETALMETITLIMQNEQNENILTTGHLLGPLADLSK